MWVPASGSTGKDILGENHEESAPLLATQLRGTVILLVDYLSFFYKHGDPHLLLGNQALHELEPFFLVGLHAIVERLAPRDRQHCDCATWLHRGREMPKEDFRREAEKGSSIREFGSASPRFKSPG